MSEKNVELARRMIGWFNARDTEAAQAHSTDDVEIVPLRAAIEDTVYRGSGAYAAFMADNDESWEELRFDAEALRDAGERVVAIGHLSAHVGVTVLMSERDSRCSSSSEATRSRKPKPTPTWRRPSKPPGCRSRRCRRRTWGVAREAVDAFNRRDLDAFVARVRPDAEGDETDGFPGVRGIYRGQAGVREWWEAWLEVWESFHFEVEEIAEGSRGRVLVGG
jgi:hypothetical protein